MRPGSPLPPTLAPRSEPRKHKLTIRAVLIAIAALAADFALFRGAETREQVQSAAVGLIAILIVLIWRYVPSPWDRLAYLVLFLGPIAVVFALIALIGLVD